MLQFLLDFLFPRLSLKGQEGEWITEEERQHLTSYPVILEEPVLRRQGLRYIDRIVAASSYRDCPLLKKAIHTFKYGRVRGLDEELGTLLVTMSGMFSVGRITLCPVPLHWTRHFSRGFNQSMLLANILKGKNGWSVQELLVRTRPTGHQTRRNREERFRAVNNAFAVRKGSELPSCVVLIDDLATTGATLENCAKALKNEGVVRVEALVLAHG